MARGKRAELDLIEDSEIGISSAIIPPLELKGWEISDVVNFTIYTIDTNEIVAQWENPKYKKNKNLEERKS